MGLSEHDTDKSEYTGTYTHGIRLGWEDFSLYTRRDVKPWTGWQGN